MQKSLAAVGVSLLGMGTIAVPSIAVATTPECGASDTGKVVTFTNGICQAVYSSGGNVYSFTTPTGATELAAIIVGAGGGALTDAAIEGYAGDGGQVRYLDLSLSAPPGTSFSIEVGVGGNSTTTPVAGNRSAIIVGGTTSFAAGGVPGVFGDECGSNYAEGTGAGGPPVYPLRNCSGIGGPGLTPSANQADSDGLAVPTILSSFSTELGKGGFVITTQIPLEQGPGQGGSLRFVAGAASVLPGSDGLVVLRWRPAVVAEPVVTAPIVTAPAAPAALAVTGLASYEASTVAILGSFVIAIGAAFTAFSFRMRRRTS